MRLGESEATSAPYFYTWSEQQNAQRFSIDSAEGVWFQLKNGTQVLDLMSTTFHAGFGYSFAPIVNALTSQLSTLPIASPKAEFDLKTQATQKLLKYLNLPEGKIFYTVSGAESIENALKIIREVSGRNIILARRNSYHGATMGALSVTGDWRNENHFSVSEWTVRIPEPHDDPDLNETRAIIKKLGPEQIAAFCLETITGMNGVIIPSKKWWSGIQRLSEEFAIPLILDEVTCGFQRTGNPFAFQDYGLQPDFVAMAKLITGGYIPFGALYVSDKFAKFYDHKILSCGLTNYAHPLGLAAMDAVLNTLEDAQFIKSIKQLTDAFSIELENLKSRECVSAVRQKGLLAAIDINKKVSAIDFFNQGVHLGVKNQTLILAPAFIMKTEELSAGFKILHGVLK